MNRNAIWLAVALLAAPGLSKESPRFKLEESSFNSGGGLAASALPSSARFSISLHALGDGVSRRALRSPGYRMDAGFAWAYPPPVEVQRLRFADEHTLEWEPERSGGTYSLYRDSIGNLAGLGFGDCEQTGLAGESATDTADVPAGDCFFYLVTARNRLGEEGTKGYRSDGSERTGTVCP